MPSLTRLGRGKVWLWYGKLGPVVVELWLLYSDGCEHGTVVDDVRGGVGGPNHKTGARGVGVG